MFFAILINDFPVIVDQTKITNHLVVMEPKPSLLQRLASLFTQQARPEIPPAADRATSGYSCPHPMQHS